MASEIRELLEDMTGVGGDKDYIIKLFEKQVRAKEAYKKVNKKQSDKIKQQKKEIEKLKEEQYDNMEKLAKEEYLHLVGFKEFDNLIEAEQENKELKKEIAEKEQLNQEKKEFYENLAGKAKEATSIIKNQKHQIHQLEATIETIKCLKEQVDASLKEENEKLKHTVYCLRQDTKRYSADEVQEYREEIEELKEENKIELLRASFDGYKAGCNYKQSVQDEIDFLNESGESPELIKEVFDESYEGGLNLVYNIETKDYSGEEEEEEGHYAVCETCDKKLFSDGQYSSITSCTYCDDCYEKLDSDEKE